MTYTDWQHGIQGLAALPLNIEVGTLYRWLGGAQGRVADVNFSRILLYVLVGVGALLLVIEMVALGNGLALAREITDSVDELFRGTVRVKGGGSSQPIGARGEGHGGQLAL